jgi:hypothetical protein
MHAWLYLPNRPENQLPNCLPRMLGVKLSILSVSPPLSFCSGVYGPFGVLFDGTVFPLGRLEGVDLRLDDSLSCVRKLRDADFRERRLRLECGVDVSMLIGVAVRVLML